MTMFAHPAWAAAALVAGGLLQPLAARAADDAIATDRPDFVESSDVVGPGRVQLETSVARERDRRGTTRTRLDSTPSLLRIGVSDTVELRVETDGLLRQRTTTAGVTVTERGQADVSLGAKWHVQDDDEASFRPGLAWLLHLDSDTGSTAFRGQGWRPSLRLTAEWALPHGWSIGVMPGLFLDRNDAGRRHGGGILAAVAGKAFTDQVRGFVEVAGQQLRSARNGGNVVSLDVGAAYLLSNTVQIDTAISRGLTRQTPDLSWTVGVSVRH